MKGIRNNDDVSDIAHNCLMCGRCDQKCPVGIELISNKDDQRREGEAENDLKNISERYISGPSKCSCRDNTELTATYDWLPETEPEKADVLFFAGCMTHLTPAIKKSMVKILDASGVKYNFIDEQGGVCCGRPLMLAGQDKEARELINYNSQMIWKSGAHTLVTSCPICYKVFKESYYLDVEVLHHTQFIKDAY